MGSKRIVSVRKLIFCYAELMVDSENGERLKTRGLDNKALSALDFAGKLQNLAETPKPLFVKTA